MLRSPFLYSCYLLWLTILFSCHPVPPEQSEAERVEFTITAYYAGNSTMIESYPVEKLTHIIFSFCHLKGNRLVIDDQQDSLTIRKLVDMKRQYPDLKVLLSLGGWGGCETCSDVFSTEEGRREFAESVRSLQDDFGTDGIDLDWEYPGISGYPGHAFKPADKQNFTMLVKGLRQALGPGAEISFAAGAFDRFFDNSVDWQEVMPLVDRVNLMTYDFRHGGSDSTGHHTLLHSTPQQKFSADYAVRYLDSLGVPKNKMVLGAAFYTRVWEKVQDVNRGLYQPGSYKESVLFRDLENYLVQHEGFNTYWDSTAMAPFAFNAAKGIFATFDDHNSIKLKTDYAARNGLNGIMFWRLGGDRPDSGLLDEIYTSRPQ